MHARQVYLFAVLALTVCVSSGARAQVANPCDQTPIVNPTLQASTVWFGLCFPLTYDDGTYVNYTSFRVTVDGADVFNGALAQAASPTPTGWVYFVTPSVAIAKGSHTALTYASDATGESPGSDPYPFTIRPGPKKGKIQVVGK